MKRTIFGLTIAAVFIPLFLFGLFFRFLMASRLGNSLAIVLIVASLSGCAAILDRDSRQCQAEAVTVAAMVECQRLYPMHNGTVTDIIAQPIGSLETVIIHRNHNHKPGALDNE